MPPAECQSWDGWPLMVAAIAGTAAFLAVFVTLCVRRR